MPGKRSSELRRLVGDIDPLFMSIAVVAGLTFAILAVLVARHTAPFFFDRPLAVDIQSVNFRPIDPFNAFVSAFSGFVGVGVGVAVVAITFILRRQATLFVAFSALYVVVYTIVNIVIKRPRPTGLAHTTSDLTGFSFPSGHVAFFVWLGVLAVVLLARGLPRPLYAACWVVMVMLVIASALSRVYVGAHWPSDVIGGLLVGIAWVALSLSLGRLTQPIFGGHRAVLR
jgi:membrane-associated phospholipid phosphatase